MQNVLILFACFPPIIKNSRVLSPIRARAEMGRQGSNEGTDWTVQQQMGGAAAAMMAMDSATQKQIMDQAAVRPHPRHFAHKAVIYTK